MNKQQMPIRLPWSLRKKNYSQPLEFQSGHEELAGGFKDVLFSPRTLGK